MASNTSLTFNGSPLSSMTARELAGYAGCSNPALMSEGEKFLLRVGNAVVKYLSDHETADRDACEVVSDCIPTSGRNQWQTFTDLGAWNEDVTEAEDALDYVTPNSRAVLALEAIGGRLAYNLSNSKD